MPKAPKDAWSASDGGEAELRDGMILARDATRLSAMNGPMTSRQGRAPLRPGHHLLEEDASGRAASPCVRVVNGSGAEAGDQK